MSSVHSRNYIYTMKAVKGILSYLVDLDGTCGPLRPADLVHTNMFSGQVSPSLHLGNWFQSVPPPLRSLQIEETTSPLSSFRSPSLTARLSVQRWWEGVCQLTTFSQAPSTVLLSEAVR